MEQLDGKDRLRDVESKLKFQQYVRGCGECDGSGWHTRTNDRGQFYARRCGSCKVKAAAAATRKANGLRPPIDVPEVLE